MEYTLHAIDAAGTRTLGPTGDSPTGNLLPSTYIAADLGPDAREIDATPAGLPEGAIYLGTFLDGVDTTAYFLLAS